MVDLFSWGVLALVIVLLALGVTRQFAVSNPFWHRLDRFGIVPQWKFFAQSVIDKDPSALDDMHLLVRSGDGMGAGGPWQEVLWRGERPLLSALWNPNDRSGNALAEHMEVLSSAVRSPDKTVPPTALAYLTILRHCLDNAVIEGKRPIQFAIVSSRGRGERRLDLRFLSDWHCR